MFTQKVQTIKDILFIFFLLTHSFCLPVIRFVISYCNFNIIILHPSMFLCIILSPEGLQTISMTLHINLVLIKYSACPFSSNIIYTILKKSTALLAVTKSTILYTGSLYIAACLLLSMCFTPSFYVAYQYIFTVKLHEASEF